MPHGRNWALHGPRCAARGCAAALQAVSWSGQVQKGGQLRSRCTAQQLLNAASDHLCLAQPPGLVLLNAGGSQPPMCSLKQSLCLIQDACPGAVSGPAGWSHPCPQGSQRWSRHWAPGAETWRSAPHLSGWQPQSCAHLQGALRGLRSLPFCTCTAVSGASTGGVKYQSQRQAKRCSPVWLASPSATGVNVKLVCQPSALHHCGEHSFGGRAAADVACDKAVRRCEKMQDEGFAAEAHHLSFSLSPQQTKSTLTLWLSAAESCFACDQASGAMSC